MQVLHFGENMTDVVLSLSWSTTSRGRADLPRQEACAPVTSEVVSARLSLQTSLCARWS